MYQIFFWINIFTLFSISSCNPTLTLDEYLNYTDYVSFIISPTDGKSFLIQTKYRLWEEDRNQYHLYLHFIETNQTKLITEDCSQGIKPIWFSQSIIYLNENSSKKKNKINFKKMNQNEKIYLKIYSIDKNETYSIDIGNEDVHSICISNETSSIYYSTRTPWTNQTELDYKTKWNNVIQYREQERGDTIFHLNIEDINNPKINKLINISLRIDEMVCVSNQNKIIYSTNSISDRIENIKDFEIYSLNLNDLNLVQLTNNNAIEEDLRLFKNDSIFFYVVGQGSVEGEYQDYQGRIYLLNLTSQEIQRWAHSFQGQITDYDILQYGNQGIVFLGQLNTTIQIYTQFSFDQPFIQRTNSNGSYRLINTFFNKNSSKIAFTYSSFEQPEEIYFANSIEELNTVKQLTNHNELFTQRNLPKGISYQWINKDDQTHVEGILLYPPDRFQQKNLSLLVLIHGGPYDADLNIFHADWYYAAIMFASHGWLVLQPNYRGSSGYGDKFLQGVLHEIVSRPGKDILYGVEALVNDGIADPMRLAIGGYSYGGYLTNWLITQTNIFNAALSGAGAVENVADWGANDMPFVNHYFLGSYPWERPDRYEKEAAIYYMNKVCTPTHIVTGELDIRVPTPENYILERALHTLGVPTKLLIFPGVGHLIEGNPWYEKIKLREELEWLDKYGHVRPSNCHQPSNLSNNCVSLPLSMTM